jgi:hypothetical protein
MAVSTVSCVRWLDAALVSPASAGVGLAQAGVVVSKTRTVAVPRTKTARRRRFLAQSECGTPDRAWVGVDVVELAAGPLARGCMVVASIATEARRLMAHSRVVAAAKTVVVMVAEVRSLMASRMRP